MSTNSIILAFMGSLSIWHWIVIIVLAMLFFGGKRLPELGRSLGQSLVEFKKGLRGIDDETPKVGGGNQPSILPPPDDAAKSSSGNRNTNS